MMMKVKRLFSVLALLLTTAGTASWAETIDLSVVSANREAKDGDVLTGTLGTNVKISIADGATVTLSSVTIEGYNHSSYEWAGISCEGDATLVLVGTNSVKGFYENYPGIHIAASKTLTIRGDGSLTACSNGYGAGIGGGRYVNCGNTVIEGGCIIATGGNNAAAIGGGDSGTCGNITITNGVTSVTVTKESTADYSIGAGSSGGTCGTITIGGTAIPDGITATTYTYLTLADNLDNSATLTTFSGKQVDVSLIRTLQTGGWNTFCAPFGVATPTGWTVKTLSDSSLDSETGTLTLTFADATGIEAGKPYLVKVASTVANPVFQSVTISGSTTTTETTCADFVPVMNPTALTGGDHSVLFVTGGNKLTYPTADGNINAFRAYFRLKGDAVDKARAFSLNLGGSTTAITTVLGDEPPAASGTYTMDGRRIDAQPTQKGVYVVNGKKMVIK